MVLLRLLGYLTAIASFVIAIADGARSIAAGELVTTPVSDLLGAIGAGQTLGVTGPLAALTAPALSAILSLPAAPVTLAIALGFVACETAMVLSVARVRQSLRRSAA